VPAPETLVAWRAVADPAALDEAPWPHDATVLRIAPDEVLIVGAGRVDIDDPHAIVEQEEGFCAVVMTRSELETWLARTAEWRLPSGDSWFTQGSAAGLPVKVWVDGDRALLITHASLARDLEERL